MFLLLDVVVPGIFNSYPGYTLDRALDDFSFGLVIIVLLMLSLGFFSRRHLFKKKLDIKNKPLKLTLLSVGHLMIDLMGIYLIRIIARDPSIEHLIFYFIIYNLIAFGFQVIFGYLADVKKLYVLFTILGIALPLLALQLDNIGIYAIILSTLGNAMYHVGGGVISVNLYPNKAAPAGIFVAPGAIGVFLGGYLSRLDNSYILHVSVIALIILILSVIVFANHKELTEPKPIKESFIKVIGLIFGVVLIRALVGLNILYPWRSDLELTLFLLTISIFLGKFLGGILGDKFRYKKIGLIGLLVSLPLIIIGYEIEIIGMLGAFFFNLTMAITLFIIIDSLGKYKGFAFGITTLALFIGYLPTVIFESFNFGIYYILFLVISIILGSYLLHKVVDIYKE